MRVVFGVIGDDIHVVANRMLHLGLQHAGFQAINLGTHNLPDDFVRAAIETQASAVLVSSINGEGEHWCRDFRKKFAAVGLGSMVLYAGGNLVIGHRNPEDVEAQFKSYGFNQVFYQYCDFDQMLNLLSEDIKRGDSPTRPG